MKQRSTDKKELADTFNNFFATVGSKLAFVFQFTGTSHICPYNNKHTLHSTGLV